MQQQQKQISTGGQSAQAATQAEGQTSTPAGATGESNQLTLKNLAQGTTEESLMKVLREISLNPSKVFFVNFDKEIYAQISFPDYQSCKLSVLVSPSSVLCSLPCTKESLISFSARLVEFCVSHIFVLFFPLSVQCGCNY